MGEDGWKGVGVATTGEMGGPLAANDGLWYSFEASDVAGRLTDFDDPT